VFELANLGLRTATAPAVTSQSWGELASVYLVLPSYFNRGEGLAQHVRYRRIARSGIVRAWPRLFHRSLSR